MVEFETIPNDLKLVLKLKPKKYLRDGVYMGNKTANLFILQRAVVQRFYNIDRTDYKEFVEYHVEGLGGLDKRFCIINGKSDLIRLGDL